MNTERLVAWAEKELQAVLQELPEDLKLLARECPVCFLPEPTTLQLEAVGGEADELLGLFEGCSRLDGVPASPDQMPRITLFVSNLWEEAEGEEDLFRQEVRITYLHELGHYLGWDEEDVEARGL